MISRACIQCQDVNKEFNWLILTTPMCESTNHHHNHIIAENLSDEEEVLGIFIIFLWYCIH